MTISKPMLAGRCSDITKLRFPVLATPKLDGIRCLIINLDGRRQAVSRNFKPIPNHHVRSWLEHHCPVGFDGELMATDGTFQQTSSAIMSRDGTPDFTYKVFDWVPVSTDVPYEKRMDQLSCRLWDPHVDLVLPELIVDELQLEFFEQDCLQDGYEGVMIRAVDSPYKCGRSTEKEGYLLKLKRFVDAEAMIIGTEEKVHNANEATTDELGRTKRSSHKANQIPMNTLGALLVRDCATGIEFRIGSGFDDATRQMLWNVRTTLNGTIVKFKSQPTGVKDKPRFPVFLGLRSPLP